MKSLFYGALFSTLVLTSACGGDDNPTSTGGGNGSITATVSGTGGFNGSLGTAASYSGNTIGMIGLQLVSANNTRLFNIALFSVTGTAGQQITINPPGVNGTIIYTESAGGVISSWSTQGTGATASVTVTSITATRIVGNFTGTLVAAAGTQATGTKTVTNGHFDVARQ